MTGPVFIVGGARSGTTLLYRLLSTHPSFRAERMDLAETRFFDLAFRWHRLERVPEGIADFLLRKPEAIEALQQRMQPLLRRMRRMDHRGLRTLVRNSDRFFRWAGGREATAAFIEIAAKARGVQRLLEKTPTHLRHASRILGAAPQAQLLHLHRHPVAVYASYRKRHAARGEAWTALTIEDFARRWRTEAVQVQRMGRRHAERFLALRYEDLVGQPRSTLQTVTRFLHERFDPGMLAAPEGAGQPAGLSSMVQGPISANAGHHEEFVSSNDQRRLEALLRRPMVALGHAPLHP